MFQVTKDEGLRKVEDLVEAFERSLKAYKSLAYKEAQVRAEYIDPFFEALGWDIYNKSHFAEAYKDVIHEDAIKTGGAHKAPDYSFRIGGRRVFFVEAKKPSVNIKDDPRVVYQLRRYGWSAGLNLSILTDFEEFAVYDCRVRPNESDKPGISRVQYLRFDSFLDQYDEIRGLFGKESVMQGSLDRYAEEKKRMRGTAPVDKEFLKEIENWRDLLARNIALRNPDLSVHDLNFAVQRIIDRIIFLRICEDRGIEHYGRLQALATGANAYQRLVERFDRAEERYNSGLFHFERERNQTTEPDNLTPRLQIDDKVLQEIFKGLYYPASPYEFSVVGADILGQVYEQFLGKVIRLTTGHRAKIEEKPEVRKAGGVYYTPTYIVDYIVKNTVGRLCEGEPDTAVKKGKKTSGSADREKRSFKLTSRQVRKLRILDPACGSGSFLIGAYQFLLDYCRDWYVANDPGKHKKAVYQGRGGQWFLTQAEKKSILLDCIYGVDIDSQAVEVTKLNLLLKALEGESRETLEQQLKLFQERALPDLGGNIKCGNSLIGTDFFDDYQDALFDDETVRRVNPFDWDGADGFPEIMQAGGFDAVIGNPPYLFITEQNQKEKMYYSKMYNSYMYRYDLYGLFIEITSGSILSNCGLMGFIIPHTFLNNDSFFALRGHLLRNNYIKLIVDLGPGVFQDARNETMLLFLDKRDNEYCLIRKSDCNLTLLGEAVSVNQKELIDNIRNTIYVALSQAEYNLIKKLRSCCATLSDHCTINQGLRTGNNERFLSAERVLSSHKPAVGGKHIGRYYIKTHIYVQYEPGLLDAPRKESIFTSNEKIVVQEVRNITLSRRIIAALDMDGLYCLQTTNVINHKNVNNIRLDIKYIIGILNSKLTNWFFKKSYPSNNHIASNQLAQIPVRDEFLTNDDRKAYDRIINYVNEMIKAKKKMVILKGESIIKEAERRFKHIDKMIDRIVYQLYGLTDEEIAIVEESEKG